LDVFAMSQVVCVLQILRQSVISKERFSQNIFAALVVGTLAPANSFCRMPFLAG